MHPEVWWSLQPGIGAKKDQQCAQQYDGIQKWRPRCPYLLNEQLIITEISYGEELSPVDVNDNIHDEKGSIYSLKASGKKGRGDKC